MGEAISVIASIGGFVTGKKKIPGADVILRGLKRLFDMAEIYSILNHVPYRSDFKLINEIIAGIPEV